MPTGDDWTANEVREVVDDYMALLLRELRGQPVKKSAAATALRARLDGRSRCSTEFKRQNASAVLQNHSMYWMYGYKPRGHYQKLLVGAVEQWINRNPDFDRAARNCSTAAAVEHQAVDLTGFLVAQPKRGNARTTAVAEGATPFLRRPSLVRDYLTIEACNRSLGYGGELHILRFEQERLSRAGRDRLAAKVEHVAASRGDCLGYDILSFEEDGRERQINVKTTDCGAETPFFASHHEVRFSQSERERYRLYRLYCFKRKPRCFVLQGDLRNHCRLDPISFQCRVT